ncbi:MAG TPA: DUF2812 domain-containing protein [Bryobacteraceae bacterium]|nr:DUF2812 domain-containing protein [Bryobacteraceae bacterium]
MSRERLVKYRFILAWQDQKEEQWLEKMAAEGWHLVSGGIRFVFERGEPQQVRYRLDYRGSYPQGEQEYFSLFRDSGWEHVCDYFAWHYFRSPASAAAPEIFTDSESRAAKYRGVLFVIALALFINLATLPGAIDRGLATSASGFARFTIGLQLSMVVFLLFVAVRLGIHIRQVRNQRSGVR